MPLRAACVTAPQTAEGDFVHGSVGGLLMYTACTKCIVFEFFRFFKFLVFSVTCCSRKGLRVPVELGGAVAVHAPFLGTGAGEGPRREVPHSATSAAARAGLGPAPESRSRGAYPHLLQLYNTDLFHFLLLPCFCSTHAVPLSPLISRVRTYRAWAAGSRKTLRAGKEVEAPGSFESVDLAEKHRMLVE